MAPSARSRSKSKSRSGAELPLPANVRRLIYARMNRADLRTLRVFAAAGDAVARERIRQILASGGRTGRRHGPFQGPLSGPDRYETPRPYAAFSRREAAAANRQKFYAQPHPRNGRRVRHEHSALMRRTGASLDIRIAASPPASSWLPAWKHPGKIARNRNGRLWESRPGPPISLQPPLMERHLPTYMWYPTSRRRAHFAPR